MDDVTLRTPSAATSTLEPHPDIIQTTTVLPRFNLPSPHTNHTSPNIYIMSFMRPVSLLRSAALRPATRVASIARPQVRFATQDYGSGDGNPAGEKPQQQGASNSESLEHPGPPPPKVARGKSSSSPNEDSGSSSTSSSSGKQSQSNDGASKSGDGQSVKGARPKILNENPPATESADVKQHNEEMKHRAEKAHEQVSNEDAEQDKVPKSFWAGEFPLLYSCRHTDRS
jgi:hypothetical protein